MRNGTKESEDFSGFLESCAVRFVWFLEKKRWKCGTKFDAEFPFYNECKTNNEKFMNAYDRSVDHIQTKIVDVQREGKIAWNAKKKIQKDVEDFIEANEFQKAKDDKPTEPALQMGSKSDVCEEKRLFKKTALLNLLKEKIKHASQKVFQINLFLDFILKFKRLLAIPQY